MIAGLDVLDIPMYSPTLAARLVGLRPERVKRWLRGYEYKYPPLGQANIQKRRQKPVVHRSGALGSPFASFLDLVDLLFLKSFLKHGISLQKLRQALTEAENLLGGHHFAHKDFWTDGKNIYLQVRDKSDALMQLLSQGQWVIAPIILQVAHQIEFDKPTGLAERWFPLGPEKYVVLDPRISFGAPTIFKRGVETASIFDLFEAEDRNLKRVCAWMKVEPPEAEAAITFEQGLLAA